ncbi:MAG: hypothetical protein IKB88_05690 [Clostridia bacterium]|nr:hypothetical protein [Clostridia bacterium]
MESEILGKEISLFLRGISSEKRKVFVMRYFYADSIKDISLQTNMSEAKIKSILHRTRKELKKHLEKEGYDL